MIVSELPTLGTSSSHSLDSDDDSDDGEDETDPILDVRAARQRVAAVREAAGVHQAVQQSAVRMGRLRIMHRPLAHHLSSCVNCAIQVAGQTSTPLTKKTKQSRRRGMLRMREASWKVLELLMSPQKPCFTTAAALAEESSKIAEACAAQSPTRTKKAGPRHCANHNGKIDRGNEQSRSSAAVAVESAPLAPDHNRLPVPLAVCSPAAKGRTNRSSAGLNAPNTQPLVGLPQFRSCSGASAVSSVPSVGTSEGERSPLTFSANEEAIMDAILGI